MSKSTIVERMIDTPIEDQLSPGEITAHIRSDKNHSPISIPPALSIRPNAVLTDNSLNKSSANRIITPLSHPTKKEDIAATKIQSVFRRHKLQNYFLQHEIKRRRQLELSIKHEDSQLRLYMKMNIEYDVLHNNFVKTIKEMSSLVKEYFNRNTIDKRIEFLEEVFFKITDTGDLNYITEVQLKHTLLYVLNFRVTEEECDRILLNLSQNVNSNHINIDQFYMILEKFKNTQITLKGRLFSLFRSFIEQFSLDNIEKYMFLKYSSVARATTVKRFNDANPPLLPCEQCHMAFFTLKQYYNHKISHIFKNKAKQ